MIALLDGAIKKPCSCCKEQKPLSEFHKDKTNPKGFGHAYYCKVCAIRKAKAHHRIRFDTDPSYREAKRDNSIRNVFGIGLKEYTAKLHAQGNKCAICNTHLEDSGTLTHLDHDHKTGEIREFLCTNCNRGLGHFKDSPHLLSQAVRYLHKHNVNVADIKEVLGC